MKNILSILSLSLVILIGYSEESIPQVNRGNEAIQRELPPGKDIDSDILYIKRSISRLRYAYRGCNFDNLASSILSNNSNPPSSEWFEAHREQFQAQVEECKGSNYEDQMILQNFENNLDSLHPSCISHASKLLTENRINGFRFNFDEEFDEEQEMTVVQRNNAIRNEVERFSTSFEEEMRRCQEHNSNTAEYPTNNDFLMNLLLLDLGF